MTYYIFKTSFLEILTSYHAQYWFLADLMSQHQNNICLEYNIYVYPQPQLPCLKSYITIYTRLQLNIQPVLGSKELSRRLIFLTSGIITCKCLTWTWNPSKDQSIAGLDWVSAFCTHCLSLLLIKCHSENHGRFYIGEPTEWLKIHIGF